MRLFNASFPNLLRFFKVHLQVLQRIAILASPPVSFEHSVVKQPVFFNVELQSRSLLAKFLYKFF